MSLIADLVAMPTRLDRWGRYLVLAPNGSKPQGYTRATTIAKTLDDGGGLLDWGKRMTAIGLAKRPDLLALVASTDVENRRELNGLCERAAEAGGSTVRRDQGIALHAALEQSWLDPESAQALFIDDVRAVHSALKAAGLTFVEGLAERIVVNDRYEVAGTFDLVLSDGTTQFIADVKTGATLMGALGFAIQLAIYANADNLYTQGASADGFDDVRDHMPVLDKSRGVILHVQPNSGHCDLHWIDLEVGAAALELAIAVRQMRKAKPLTPIATSQVAVERVLKAFPGATEVTVVSEDWRMWMRGRIMALIEAKHQAEVAINWPDNVPTLKSGKHITSADGVRIVEVISMLEKEYGMPFPDVNPDAISTMALPEWMPTGQELPVDEGDKISQEDVKRINLAVKAFAPDAIKWIAQCIKEAAEAGLPINLTGKGGRATQRRAAICEALCALADNPVDLAVPLLEFELGTHLNGRPFGAALAHLTIAQAQSLTTAALA